MTDNRSDTSVAGAATIEDRIYVIRGQKVMLDSDLAEVYGLTIRKMNQQVKRNTCRVAVDFIFELTTEEATNLRSQSATSRFCWG